MWTRPALFVYDLKASVPVVLEGREAWEKAELDWQDEWSEGWHYESGVRER